MCHRYYGGRGSDLSVQGEIVYVATSVHAAIDTAVLHGIVAKVLLGTVAITSVHTDTVVLHSIVATVLHGTVAISVHAAIDTAVLHGIVAKVLHGTVATSVHVAIDTAMLQLNQCCTSL